jgi:hypothetical protein
MFLDVGDCSWEWVQKQRRGLRDQPSTRRTGCDSQPLAPMSKQVTESTMRMDGSRAASEITRSTSGLPQKPATCNQIEASRQNIPIILAGENVALGALRQKKPTALVLFLLNIFFWSSIAQSPNIKYSYGRPPNGPSTAAVAPPRADPVSSITRAIYIPIVSIRGKIEHSNYHRFRWTDRFRSNLILCPAWS